ncbi:uncharacterized protein LOC111061212 isoform X2 [Nilaparvata lugens]|uniref:uncharacterized protein LOC111061212 isoform X2 n=1 Tax=Nilaparvata lugens TaxID=108931 RepID=UPI00193DAE31|nr:uncharacterized protein LOC111061212 isoform X2 [Nilaparvata lugens]
METRSKTRHNTPEDDKLSSITGNTDSTDIGDIDDVDDKKYDEEIPSCFECEEVKPLTIHKGDLWCKECIRNDLKNDDVPKSKDKKDEKQETQVWTLWTLLSILIILPVGISLYYTGSMNNYFAPGSNQNISVCSDLKAEMKQLKSQFGSQESDTWLNFYSGIRHVQGSSTDRVGSATFLLLHEARARPTADSIARHVGRLAAACLGGNLLHLDGTSMADQSQHKLFLQKYQKKVEESRVLMVSGFERLPSAIAKEFHFFCDSYNPLVPHTVFILLLQVDQLPTGDDVTAAAEVHLKRIWAQHMNANIIQPLITRITANVVRIYE